jgi:glycosyltransferase involved in cell wall biosynthesis
VSEPIRVLELRSVRGTGGGPEKTVLQGARRADPARFKVTVCYLRDQRDREFTIDRRADDLGLDYVEIHERHSYDPAIWSQLRKLTRDRRAQIVHAHEYKTNILTWLLARYEPIIPLSTVHGWFGRDTWRERVYYGADRRVLARFPKIIAVSAMLRDELVAAGCRPERITVITNGIDHHAFARVPGKREEMRRSLGIADTDVVIGAVGRLERQKLFDVLMEAVATLRQRRPNVRLFIAGTGGLQDELMAAHRRLNLGDACVLLGHRTDVVALHHAFDLFVQASDREGSPNVVLEAMALETPTIATNAGGTADLIDDGVHGLIVPANSRDALVAAIDRALDDWPATLARAAAARKRIVDELSFDRRMDRVETIYEELMRNQPVRR